VDRLGSTVFLLPPFTPLYLAYVLNCCHIVHVYSKQASCNGSKIKISEILSVPPE
jgi:hypothetical protein